MKYLKKFQTESELNTFNSSSEFIRPNLCAVVERVGVEGVRPIIFTPKPSIITFTVDGVAYEADPGMYWHEWLESDYNTVGAFQANPDVWATVIWNNKALTLNGEYVYCTDSTYPELESDAIVENGAYETTRLPGPI